MATENSVSVERKCLFCGASFPTKTHANGIKKIYCSLKCRRNFNVQKSLKKKMGYKNG